ncbi:hypothetical protein Q7P35_006506 [Cladosporium inversicolor]
MRLTWTATLAIAYSNRPTKATRNKPKAPVPLKPPQLEPHPNRLDLQETQLSADILAMQRLIRESKGQDCDAHAAPEIERKPEDHAIASLSKSEHTAEGDVRMSRKDHWEKLKLEEVQRCDLEAMDLTGLSPSLLAHPEGSSMDYTERERRMVKALLEKEVSRWMEASEKAP